LISDCGKTFSQADTLKRHVRFVHLGIHTNANTHFYTTFLFPYDLITIVSFIFIIM
jgi:hypothetical protein